MQKVWKSVNIWRSYREYKGGNFFWDTVYNVVIHTYLRVVSSATQRLCRNMQRNVMQHKTRCGSPQRPIFMQRCDLPTHALRNLR